VRNVPQGKVGIVVEVVGGEVVVVEEVVVEEVVG